MEMSEKLESLAKKMRELEKAVEQSKTRIDDAALTALKTPVNAALTVVEKAIDGMQYIVNRFFNKENQLKGGESEE